MAPAPASQALSPSGLPGLCYSLNPYRGCAHACAYCYAPATLRGHAPEAPWGTVVGPKTNVVDLLARELRRRRRGAVGVGTVTDPYQPAEAAHRLTRGCLSLLAKARFPFYVQTKSDLVVRDADLLASAPGASVGVTVTTLDEGLAARLEPGAPPPSSRADALRRLEGERVETWVALAPVIPGLNDSEGSLGAVVRLAAETRSRLLLDRLNLRRGVAEGLARALGGFDPTGCTGWWWEGVVGRVGELCAAEGVAWERAF